MKQGHIKVFRSIEDWEWFRTSGMLDFWVRLLLKAEWSGDERGSIVTSVSDLAKDTGCTVKQVRVFLSRLTSTGEITTSRARSTARTGTTIRTRITICNYDSYQGSRQKVGRELGQEVRQEQAKNEGPLVGPSPLSPAPPYPIPPISPIPQQEEEKKEEDTDVSSKKERPDFSFVMKLWNDSVGRKIPKIAGLSQARKEKIQLRVAEMGGWGPARTTLSECFRKIRESEFCNGATGKWTATFDWFFSNEKNWLKVYEGNYDNRRSSRVEQYVDPSRQFTDLLDQLYGTSYNGTEDGLADTPDEQ